jgi:hypothetical protein
MWLAIAMRRLRIAAQELRPKAPALGGPQRLHVVTLRGGNEGRSCFSWRGARRVSFWTCVSAAAAERVDAAGSEAAGGVCGFKVSLALSPAVSSSGAGTRVRTAGVISASSSGGIVSRLGLAGDMTHVVFENRDYVELSFAETRVPRV